MTDGVNNLIVERHNIYNLDFSYTRIIQDTEIDFKGTLSYHMIDLDLLKQTTGGKLGVNTINVFLSFQIQRHLDLILKDITVNEIINQRPIIINRLKTLIRRELEEVGLELVDFKRISLWGYGASDHGFNV